MTQNEKTFRQYTTMWRKRDASALPDVMAEDIVCRESHGAEYRGIEQMRMWFADCEKSSRVIEWEVKRSFEINGMLAAEWYYVSEDETGKTGYDGVSIARFNSEGKIREIRDYRAEWKHTHPYDKR